MSNFLAIATVTATLQRLLQETVQLDVPGATATTQRPDASNTLLPTVGVNIYLYQTTPNGAWRNADLPTRSAAGHVVQRPCAAIDLHYLLTCYGTDGELEPQRVLGSVVRTLHARPVLTRPMVEATLQAAELEDPNHYLLGSNLADSVELVKFTPTPFTLEELSKLWSVLFQTPYSLSMAYTGTVVFIEAEETPRRPLPVRVRSITASPFQRPVIEDLVDADDEEAPIVFGATLAIRGQQLGGLGATVRVGGEALTPTSVTGQEIQVNLTDPALRAGVQGVQVTYDTGAASGVAPLVLRPAITPGAVAAGSLTISFDPAVGRRQRVVLFLNELNPPTDGSRDPFAYSFEAPSNNGITNPAQEATTTITFALAGVAPEDYLVRVQVAGAENALTTNASGDYTGPTVTIP
jgi:hypothetical protein